MISSNKSPESQNALVRRIQRYAQASTIFRSTEPSGEAGSGLVQRSTQSTSKASFLSTPSSLPVGRTVGASGATRMPPQSAPFPVELPSAPVIPDSSIDSLSAAISQAEQLQRSYEAQGLSAPTPVDTPVRTSSQQQPPPAAPPSTPPILDTSSSIPPTVQKAPEPSGDLGNDWNRLQRIFKGHTAKSVPETSSPAASPEIQRQESRESAASVSSAETDLPPASPPDLPTETIQRAVQAAESTTPSTTPQKAPLESMWPVEQVDTPETTSDEPVVMRQPDTPISTEPTQTPAEAETIRRKLGDVSVTRASDSSVELHLPRRPRPASIQAKEEPVDPNKAFWDRMRKAEGKPETVQRTVETEIGPLPSDMWELLGETPPEPPTEIPSTGGESTPNVQPKRTDSPDDDSPMQSVDSEETNIPSFLAEAATTAPNTPDTLQRAIAAAESTTDEVNSDTTATPSPVQRKETEPSPISSVRETTIPDNMPGSEQTVEYNAFPIQESATEPSIQRAASDANATLSESGDVVAGSLLDESSGVSMEAGDTPASSDVSVTDTTTAVQRAIATAESKPTKKQIQAKRTEESAPIPTPPIAKTLPTVLPQPVSTKETTANKETVQRTADTPETQLPDSTPQTAVDLNADTAPLPELPEMASPETAVTTPSAQSSAPDAIQRAIAAAETPSPTEEAQVQPTAEPAPQPTTSETVPESTSQTAVTPSTAQAATPDTIQRAIAAAETAPPPTVEPSAGKPQASELSESTQIQRTADQDPQPTTSESASESASQTAVIPPSAQAATPDALQRAIAAAETAPPLTVELQASKPSESNQIQRTADQDPQPTTSESAPESASQTAVSTPSAQSSTSDALQRAITTAETAPPPTGEPSAGKPQASEPSESTQIQRTADQDPQPTTSETAPESASQTAVTPPSVQSSTPDALQRAIAAAETAPPPTGDKATDSKQIESSQIQQTADKEPQPTTSETAPESASQTADTPLSEQSSTPDALQSAIAAAELPTKPSTSETITPTAPPPPARPETILANKTQTAVSQPKTPSTLQRAIAAAEAPPISTSISTQVPPPSHATTTTTLMQPTPTLSNIISDPTPPAAATRTSQQEQIQRAIATAEMPPTTSTTLPTTTPDSQTAVSTPLIQTPPTTSSSLMRALGQAEGATTSNPAESTTKPSQEPYQWPDIKPTGTQQTQDTIQRTENDNLTADIDSEPEESAPPIDIDQLANTVYSQLRKRLAVEWERGRGKR